jgi:hypothetical protein
MGYKKGVALNATNGDEDNHSSKPKEKTKVVEDPSREEEGNDEVALLIKIFKRFIKKKSYKRNYGDDKER